MLSVVLGLLGVTLGSVGLLGLQGKLRRNRYVGVRTPAAMRDEETFALANRVAGVPCVAAGAVAIVSGAMSFVMADLAVTAGIIGLVGTLGIAFAGGIAGSRAAALVPEPVKPKGCGGCACGGGGCSPLAGL